MTSPVYFMDLRASYKRNLVTKLRDLLAAAGMADRFAARDLVGVKLHFGEQGNTAFIRPVYIRAIVEEIRSRGGQPFLTDANTLYAGTRGNAVEHTTTAVRNGFAYSVVDAPIVIADGLRGRSETAVTVDLNRFQTVYIAREIAAADALVSVAHFKGHELAGFGGTLKNLGMGCASRRGKMAQHSTMSPNIKAKKCIGCGECVDHCSTGAIHLVEEKAAIDADVCIGCGECILVCPQRAVDVRWNQSVPVFLESMVEYTAGVLQSKAGKAFFVNFITDVSPACDCMPYNDQPLVRDMGIVAGTDPVAVDQASVDLVNAEPALAGCELTVNTGPGEDKFRGVYPHVDWSHQLAYAEQIGLGSREYERVLIE